MRQTFSRESNEARGDDNTRNALGTGSVAPAQQAVVPEGRDQRALVASGRRALFIRAAYVAVVLLATLTNLEFSPALGPVAYRLSRAFSPSLGWRDAIDGLRNLVLFAGLGAVWTLTAFVPRAASTVRRATAVALLLSAIIEATQLFSPVRDASILDVTTDTAGAFVGALLIVWTLNEIARHDPRQGAPPSLVAGPYLLAVIAEALTPLFESAPLATDGGPVARFRAMWELSSHAPWKAIPLSDVPLFFSAGVLGLFVCRRWGPRKRWMTVLGLGPIAVIAAHLAHGAAGLPIRWGAIATDTTAFIAGVCATGCWLRWNGPMKAAFHGTRWALLAYAALLVLWGWRPFTLDLRAAGIANQLTAEQLEPLRALSQRIDLFSVAHTAQQFLLYVPLGVLLAWDRDTRRMRAHMLAACVLALIIELGHLFVALRTFDVTNALLAWAGLAVGWAVVHTAQSETARP